MAENCGEHDREDDDNNRKGATQGELQEIHAVGRKAGLR
jgi:hypothetical protein